MENSYQFPMLISQTKVSYSNGSPVPNKSRYLILYPMKHLFDTFTLHEILKSYAIVLNFLGSSLELKMKYKLLFMDMLH